jgi:hypothetical protein
MDKIELQEAQSIIDSLYFDGKVITGWQHTLLENVISIAETKLGQTKDINSVCECEAPLVRGYGDDEYCGLCQKRFMK